MILLLTYLVGFWTTFYVYAMEMVGGKWKTLFGIGFEYPWALAYRYVCKTCIKKFPPSNTYLLKYPIYNFSTLPGIAYAVRNWNHLQLIISVPPIIFLIIYHFIPESPRWVSYINIKKFVKLLNALFFYFSFCLRAEWVSYINIK